MNSIFEKTANKRMINRIKKLTPESRPLWGEMTVDQMCKHCVLVIRISQDKVNLKFNNPMRIVGRLLRSQIMTDELFQKNIYTAKELIIHRKYDFEKAKNELILSFSRFAIYRKDSIQKLEHPFFGELTHKEWDLLMWKHLDHHLRQFKV